MIIDTSVLIAILRNESDAEKYANAMQDASHLRVSAANYLETTVVIDANRDPVLSRRVDELMTAARITIEPVSEEHARIARAAYRDFGKGSGHPAGLNFGDCFAYALAKQADEPLLFKGQDFIHTDLVVALEQL